MSAREPLDTAAATVGGLEAVLRSLDTALAGRALVFGSLPPHGRDLDLLVQPADQDALEATLSAVGFLSRGRQWALFGGCSSTLVVELLPAARLRLPPEEEAALFAEGRPLPGLARIVEPAPPHALLILARRLVRAGALEPKHRRRLEQLLAQNPSAWEASLKRAAAWNAEAGLAHLQALYDSGDDRPLPRRLRPRRPRRTRALSVAAADSAKATFHAGALCDALDRLGFECAVESVPAGRGLRRTLRQWQPIWRRLGRGGVILHVEVEGDPAPQSRSDPLRLLRPRPLRRYALDRLTADGDAATRDRVCSEIALDAWLALSRRSRVADAIRRRSRSRARARAAGGSGDEGR